jgi:VanZ family protein
MPTSRRNLTGIRFLLGLTLSITTYLSLSPQPAPLPDLAFADKWAHALTYFLLAFPVDASWPDRGFGARKWGSLFSYGLAIELIQSQIPNRLFSLGDLAANAIGLALYGLVLLRLLRRASTG